MSLLNNIGNILHKGLDGLKTIAKVVFQFGDDLTNGIKAIEATPVGSEIIGAVETVAGLVIPQQYQIAFKAWFPTFIKDMGWVKDELNKSDDDIVADFVTWFTGLTKPAIKASVAHVIAANGSLFVSDQIGAGVTPQQALTLPQIVHDPTIFDAPVASAVVNSLSPATTSAPLPIGANVTQLADEPVSN